MQVFPGGRAIAFEIFWVYVRRFRFLSLAISGVNTAKCPNSRGLAVEFFGCRWHFGPRSGSKSSNAIALFRAEKDVDNQIVSMYILRRLLAGRPHKI